MTAQLVLHRGGREVSREELDAVPCPAPEGKWRPVPHGQVLRYAETALVAAGYEIQSMHLGLSRDNSKFFGVASLTTPIVPGVGLAVGLRSSTDKSIALQACFGSRTFVCDNLAFQSTTVVTRKHTTFGIDRYQEAIAKAISELQEFRTVESKRIEWMRDTDMTDERAESNILRAFEQGILGYRNLETAIQEWREPSFDEFRERKNVWRCFNSITSALRPRIQSNPQAHASATIKLGGLLCPPVESFATIVQA